MSYRILQIVWINVFCFTMSLSVCAQSQSGERQREFAYANRSALQLSSADMTAEPAQKRETSATAIFVFHTDEFWLNLHHFLYVLGRAENNEVNATRDAVAEAPRDQERGLEKLSEKEQLLWREAVAFYASRLSKKDLVFDDAMPALTNALARAGNAKSLTGSDVDATIAATLERAAPVYRKAWWRNHLEANRKWTKSIQVLVDRHGATVLAFITKAYQLQWPAAGFPVHVSAYTNWAGAYSTRGNLLVIASLPLGNQAAYGLETIFHEGMHQWDMVFEALGEQAKKANKVVPRGLSHALIFFTAGEAVRNVLPEHVPYAEEFGVWQRGMAQFKAALEEVWKPYLYGQGTRDEALLELVKRTAIEPTKK